MKELFPTDFFPRHLNNKNSNKDRRKNEKFFISGLSAVSSPGERGKEFSGASFIRTTIPFTS